MKQLNSIAILCAMLATTALADNATNAPVKLYPLKTCLVCGMDLGMMGQPYEFVYQGQQIKLCDKSEKELFDKSPDKYLKKLADAAAKLKK
jgi:YHS domain-containing protein